MPILEIHRDNGEPTRVPTELVQVDGGTLVFSCDPTQLQNLAPGSQVVEASFRGSSLGKCQLVYVSDTNPGVLKLALSGPPPSHGNSR